MGNKDDAVKFKTDTLLVGRTDIELIRPEKGTIISLPGAAFHGHEPNTDDLIIDVDEGTIKAQADGITLICPIQLPEGAIVTEVIVWGNAAAIAGETYSMIAMGVNYSGDNAMCTASIGTASTTIAHATIENGRFHYYITTSSIDTNDTLYGLRIKYRW